MKNDIKYFDVIPVHPLFGCTLPESFYEDGFITSIRCLCGKDSAAKDS